MTQSVSNASTRLPLSEPDEATIGCLDSAIADLEPYLQERIIPSSQVINPLLGVWTAAHSVNPSVACPVGDMLTVLVSRTTTTPAELVAVLDEVQIAVLQARLRAHS